MWLARNPRVFSVVSGLAPVPVTANWATGWLRGGGGSPGLEVLGTAQHGAHSTCGDYRVVAFGGVGSLGGPALSPLSPRGGRRTAERAFADSTQRGESSRRPETAGGETPQIPDPGPRSPPGRAGRSGRGRRWRSRRRQCKGESHPATSRRTTAGARGRGTRSFGGPRRTPGRRRLLLEGRAPVAGMTLELAPRPTVLEGDVSGPRPKARTRHSPVSVRAVTGPLPGRKGRTS
ncbi:hypothetical protein THAOC_34567 [Thalassiosira oceanica]|uniref:Uncharacterized protein n=1 Tax=Thalassiosira oceanica TaxID=159749 RepID=K0RCH5_THAOC|nr:hypothetical protein THAOC_34567 [Thalassiosira oceanica]|eukprot:EJK46751.1 hypothetical protein THAOC_34567 [Thalassiosira oceanica]